MMAPRVIIVGASVAGLTAAETLRDEGFDGEVILVGSESRLPYTRPPLSKQVLLAGWDPDQATIRTADRIEQLGVRLLGGCSGTGLDIGARILETTRGPLAFDELIIATGSQPRVHPDLPAALRLRTMDDALRLRDGLRGARRLAVVGPGILGSEIAGAARRLGISTVLIGRSGALSFGSVGALLSGRLARLHTDNGVELVVSSRITAGPAARGGTEIALDGAPGRRFDLVVSVIGTVPCTGWLRSSDLAIDDGVVCDSDGRAAPGVSAIGDVAAWADPRTGRHLRVEHQSSAIEQAISVAIRVAKGDAGPHPVPFFWSEVHGARIQACGWFDQSLPLTETRSESSSRGVVLESRSVTGDVRGVVGWDASPRDFRAARGSVMRSQLLPSPAQ